MTALGLAACSSGSNQASSGSATKGTINWWGWTPTNSQEAKDFIAEFNKKYPDIKVNFKLIDITSYDATIRAALASSGGPDLFDLQPGARVQQFGPYAEDMAPVAKAALGSDWKSKIAPIAISGMTLKGKLTALPVGSTYAGMLWINSQLFDKYNLKPPTTLDEWKKDCQVFKQNGVGCFVQGAAQEGFDQDTLQSISNSVEPGLWTKASQGKAKWNDPTIVKTLSIWKDLFDSGIMQSGALGAQQYPDANNQFLTGKYAMIMMGTWYTQYATEKAMTEAISAAGVAGAKTFPILPVAFPDVASKGHTSEMYGDADYGLAVASKSKNRAAAETFAKWIATTKQGQQVIANRLDTLPTLKGIKPDFTQIKFVDPSLQSTPVNDLLKKVGSVNEPREALLSADVQNAILAAAQSVAGGSASPQQAANTLEQAAEAAANQ
ncbi:ABC transporter substrate-binding protein [Humibacter sp.]|uniref:ABC transporter substrate-binding protein n=1 Tax=Humibacter sp. TaxID=1940291 RepID=UPI002CE1EA23|nr:extracellular solute-binding protein [Humibacter sp.]HVX07693.1 extracellular solute-binding protein [Humibacter sp.]